MEDSVKVFTNAEVAIVRVYVWSVREASLEHFFKLPHCFVIYSQFLMTTSTRVARTGARLISTAALSRTNITSRPSICRQCLRAFSSSLPKLDEATPQARLQSDLKAALRAKSKPKLTVLRSLLAEITNASKGSKPITTNTQLLSVVRKKQSAAETAIREFKDSGRQDLADKETEEKNVLDEYVASFGGGEANPEQVESSIKAVIEELKPGGGKVVMGDVLKRLLGPGGALEGKADGKTVAATVKRILA